MDRELYPMVTEAQRAGVIAAISEAYGALRDQFHPAAEHLSDALAGYHLIDMLEPDELRARLQELIK